MKRLGTMERVALAMAVLFIVCGAIAVVHPTEDYVFHPADYRSSPWVEVFTRRKARVCGFITMGVGGCIAWLALYRPREEEDGTAGDGGDDPPEKED